MLRLHPDKRAKAADLVHHNWLEGIVVQGEIDVIRRAEEMEKSRREAIASVAPPAQNANGSSDRDESTSTKGQQSTSTGHTNPTSREKKRLSGLTQSEVDAMKPVGEIEEEEEEEEQPSRHDTHGRHQPPILSAAPIPASALGKENVSSPRHAPSGKANSKKT